VLFAVILKISKPSERPNESGPEIPLHGILWSWAPGAADPPSSKEEEPLSLEILHYIVRLIFNVKR